MELFPERFADLIECFKREFNSQHYSDITFSFQAAPSVLDDVSNNRLKFANIPGIRYA